MSTRNSLMLSAVLLTTAGPAALASSHREAPAIAADPVADNTDLYAWVKATTHDRLYIIAAYNPFEEPSGGPNFHGFSDEVLYEIHIAKGASSLADAFTLQFRFTTTPAPYVDPANLTLPPGGGKEFFGQLTLKAQTYSVTLIQAGQAPVLVSQNVPVAPIDYGPRSFSVLKQFGIYTTAETSYTEAFAASFIKPVTVGTGGQVFAGPRDDGFYVDLGGVFDLANLRAKGTAQDGVSGYNCHAIALDLPTAFFTGGTVPTAPSNANTLGIWASASRRKVRILRGDGSQDGHGPWVQVSRLGLPLINEAVIGVQDKDRFNRLTPASDLAQFGAYFLNPVIVRDAEAVGIYTALGVDPTPFKSNRTDIIDVINIKNFPTAGAHNITSVGDVLRLDPGFDSGFPNGRSIAGGTNREGADVTDVLVSLLLTKAVSGVSDGVDYNDKNFLSAFPYLAAPWTGYHQGHGKPTP